MKASCLLLLVAAGAPLESARDRQDPAPSASAGAGLAIERTVKLTSFDWLGRRQEIQRKEAVRIRGSDVAITDLTFGERLIIRSDLKKVWKVDPLSRQYSEYTFDQVAAIRKSALDEVRSAKARVPGTADERELDALLEGYDQFAAAPKVEVKTEDLRQDVIVNGALVRASLKKIDAQVVGWPGYVQALAGIGAFHPAVAEKLGDVSGFPVKGTLRYVLFLDRVVEEFEVTSAKAEAVPDADFELPAKGLAKVPLKGFERPAERRPEKPALFKRDFKEDEIDRQSNPLQGQEKKDKP